ncbi:MAG: outer membrane protein TolC [Gammaproteobacteria bacterium]|jgi:outer membrane protein TolC
MPLNPILRTARPLTAACTVLLLAGCATFSDDGGFTLVADEADDKLGTQARWLKDDASKVSAIAEVDALLSKELTADSAMQIALLSNPTLQGEYANLGIAEADLVQAGRLPNPGFSFGKTTGGGAQEIERGLHFNLMAVLTIPARVGIETRRFEAAKLAAAAATVEVGLEARAAYFSAIAARQSLAYFDQVLDSAQASRELMTRMTRVGNSSRLELAREQLFHAEATAALAMAAKRERGARETLIRALGLWGEQSTVFRLPQRLPDLPTDPEEFTDIEKAAIAQRLDIRQARHTLDSLASNLNLTQTTRFINVLEAGAVQVRDRGEPIRDGYEISLEIPIFDWGGAKIVRAQALYNQAAERLRATAINARSEVRQAYLGYRTAYDLAKHYRDEVVPLRKRISDEQLLRYNGMLIGVFELISDAREQVASVSAYLDALREFWISDTSLKTAMLAGSAPMGGSAGASLPSGGNGGGH